MPGGGMRIMAGIMADLYYRPDGLWLSLPSELWVCQSGSFQRLSWLGAHGLKIQMESKARQVMHRATSSPLSAPGGPWRERLYPALLTLGWIDWHHWNCEIITSAKTARPGKAGNPCPIFVACCVGYSSRSQLWPHSPASQRCGQKDKFSGPHAY